MNDTASTAGAACACRPSHDVGSIASDHGALPDLRQAPFPADVPAGAAMITLLRTAFADAWDDMWDRPAFRALVAFDAVISAGTAGILAYCFFYGKIGLLK